MNTQMVQVKDVVVIKDFNPRKVRDAEADKALAENIKARGLIMPLTVKPVDGGKFQLVAGHRRLEALKAIGAESVMVSLADVGMSEKDALLLNLAENTAREDLTPYETAAQCEFLRKKHKVESVDISKAIGKVKSYVNIFLVIMDKVDDTILERWKKQHPLATVSWLYNDLAKLSKAEQKDAWDKKARAEKQFAAMLNAQPDPKKGKKGKKAGKVVKRPGADVVAELLEALKRNEEHDTALAAECVKFCAGTVKLVKVGGTVVYDPAKDPETPEAKGGK